MKKKSLAKNYIYNAIYQIFVLIVPLITTPYLSRILGADGIGKYSFTFSLTNYFILIAALGFGYYAQREIANHQDDKKSQSLIFWEILIVRFFSVGFSVALNCILATSGVYKTYTQLMWWWLILIVAQEFDITFLFQGNEDFLRIVLRNVLIKIASIVLIFTLIKNPSQIWLYIVCYAGSTLLGNLSLWFGLPKCLVKVKWNELHPTRHVIPTLRLFVPTIAISIYTILDKTLIGVLIKDTYLADETQIINGVEETVQATKKYADLENGYYEQADKIVKMCLAILTSLGTVMIPRNSHEFAVNNTEGLKKNIYFSSNYLWFLGVPMTLGLIALAPNLVPWFFGKDFTKAIFLMQIMSPLIIIIGFSNLFGLQYLVPTKRDKKFTYAILAGTITNLVLDIPLIIFQWSVGAVIASIVSESVVTATMIVLVRKEISFGKMLKQSWKYLVAGGG